MYGKHTVSVVMPAYNEEQGVLAVIKDFQESSCVDEIVVIDNNSTDRTAELALRAQARVIREAKQGYGHACKRALLEAKGDYIILVESDGTFTAKDMMKFLAYADDFDLVQGTRTTKGLIAEKAKMYFTLKWANRILAKVLQALYCGPPLSDMGCTYRLIKRQTLDRMKEHLTVGGPAFLAEMTVVALKQRVKMIEIPVSYLARQGDSKITKDFAKTAGVAIGMMGVLLKNLFRRF